MPPAGDELKFIVQVEWRNGAITAQWVEAGSDNGALHAHLFACGQYGLIPKEWGYVVSWDAERVGDSVTPEVRPYFIRSAQRHTPPRRRGDV